MFYCLECTNKCLTLEPLLDSEVNTEVFVCGNCLKELPCVISIKGKSVVKISMKAHESFLKRSSIELIRRWNDEDFQKEKEIFIKAFKQPKFFWCE